MLTSEVIYTVSHLNQTVHHLLENNLGWVKVQGEISNLKKASSGHYYFSLKDSTCQVNCVLFASKAYTLEKLLANGQDVLAIAKVGLYQPRGDYQLTVHHLEDIGAGKLQIAFEQLKKKLAEQGLFDTQFKRPLPVAPHTVGVVTSPSGAAIRDILATLKRRFITAEIIIYPTEVQGQQAAPKIAKAIQIANQRQECDVLIVARGGGSIEDLWPFNEEIVAWAIFNSTIPIVTGIGHQIDTTIADYVADYVASTPTAAAEAVAPHQKDWLQQIQQWLDRIQQTFQHQLYQKKQYLALHSQKLRLLPYHLQERWQTLDRLESALKHAYYQILSSKKAHLNHMHYRLTTKNPLTIIQQSRLYFNRLAQRLDQAWQKKIHQQRQRFFECLTTLRVVSPLATLERGYALAMTSDHKIIRASEDVSINDAIEIKLAQMELMCIVQQINLKR